MFKKILILGFMLYLTCIATNVSALAIVDEKEITYGCIDERLRSLQLPTNSLDISKQSYKANFISASNRWLYTDVYFKTASNNTITVNYNLSSNNGQNAKAGIYDISTGSWIDITYGLVGTTSANNLISTHKYVVVFVGNGTNTINDTIKKLVELSY